MHAHVRYLQRDTKLKAIIGKTPLEPIVPKKNICLALCTSILSQQLSIKAAAAIQQRFMALFATKNPGPKDILALSIEQMRSVGLSQSKANYMHHVCAFFLEHNLSDRALLRMNDDELMALLIQIKGVGQWTIHMLLMFTIGHEDVFAPDDLGIRQAMVKLYGLEDLSPRDLRKKMTAIASAWSPYRSYGCRYLWAWKDL